MDNIQKKLPLGDKRNFYPEFTLINRPYWIKHFLGIFFLLFVSNTSFSQPDSLFIKEKIIKIQVPEWNPSGNTSIDLSQITFTNWNSGGANSFSALLGFYYEMNYTDKYIFWNNNLNFRYGFNKQQRRELRKTDDLFELTSNLGYKGDENSNWFYSARFNFKTQIANGYKYPDKTNPISRLMAPGYFFLGAGMEYGKKVEALSFYFSPLTLKATFVLDKDLANSGAFGVRKAVFDAENNLIKPGQKIRNEVGILITNSYKIEVTENIIANNLLSLYTDYVNNFGNIDIDWRIGFNFRVNSFIRTTLESHIRYDDDVKIAKSKETNTEFDEPGEAKIQWKQFLGIGFALDL